MKKNRGNALHHFIKVILGRAVPHSQTTDKEKQLIIKYCKNKKTAIEIGVYEGVNTINISRNISKDGILYAIDPFFKGRLGINYGKVITISTLKRNKLFNKVKILDMYSWQAVSLINSAVDFIFIDGDHTYEGIKKDWEDWAGKVLKGGIIALHDTSIPSHDPTVKGLGSYEYFNEKIKFDDRFKIIDNVDSLNILVRI